MRELSFIKWSKVGPQLAIGTGKGSLLIYNRKTFKKIPIIGKHTKMITCGAWNLDNKLALGSIDRQLTISNEVGDSLEQLNLRMDPIQITVSGLRSFACFKIMTRGNQSKPIVAANTPSHSICQSSDF